MSGGESSGGALLPAIRTRSRPHGLPEEMGVAAPLHDAVVAPYGGGSKQRCGAEVSGCQSVDVPSVPSSPLSAGGGPKQCCGQDVIVCQSVGDPSVPSSPLSAGGGPKQCCGQDVIVSQSVGDPSSPVSAGGAGKAGAER